MKGRRWLMADSPYPKLTRQLADTRRKLAPEAEAAFREFGEAVFREGALSRKTKQLIAVAVAHVTQCPYCIQGHVKSASRIGATPEEVMEAIWVAAEMRAGGRSEEHTSELQSLMRISYAVFCLKKKTGYERQAQDKHAVEST